MYHDEKQVQVVCPSLSRFNNCKNWMIILFRSIHHGKSIPIPLLMNLHQPTRTCPQKNKKTKEKKTFLTFFPRNFQPVLMGMLEWGDCTCTEDRDQENPFYQTCSTITLKSKKRWKFTFISLLPTSMLISSNSKSKRKALILCIWLPGRQQRKHDYYT